MTEGIWTQLLTLAFFWIFVTAMTEVVKALSVRGLFKFVKELFLTIKSNEPLSVESIHLVVFILGITLCYVFDYGAMTDILKVDISKLGATAAFFDYFGTASVVYMGADWVFNTFAAVQAKAKNARAVAEANGDNKGVLVKSNSTTIIDPKTLTPT